MSEKPRIVDLYGSEYQIRWRGLLGFFGPLSAAYRLFHGRISASSGISRIENHKAIPPIHDGETFTAAHRVSSLVPKDAGALANLWTPIPHLRSEMSGHRSRFGPAALSSAFFTTPAAFLQHLPRPLKAKFAAFF